MRIVFIVPAILVFLSGFGQAGDSLVVIGKKDSIHSRVLGENRPYWIHLPSSYNDNNGVFERVNYPVLYLLDGDAHFNSVSGLIQILGGGINGTNVVPDMIVVAIPNTDRTRDLTPTHAIKDNEGHELPFLKTSGGGERFLQFIKTELIPHIDSSYRTMPYRIFVGHSFGGITVINAIYTMPETFNAYIAIDPSLWWDHQVLLDKARTYFQNASLHSTALYLGQANTLESGDTSINQHYESIREFALLLETRNRSGIRWKYDFYPDDDHGSVPFISEYNGLRFIFSDYRIKYSEVYKHPEKIQEQFQKLYEETHVHFKPPESILNGFGYQALNNKSYDLAIRFFQMNIDYYPNSSNVYDSMGEAWMNKGDNKKAIEYYKHSIQLNPSNKSAVEMINKMQAQKK
ncbi:MAG: alpha/beta hydrolase-fold protein [Chitinophagales bacterium]